MIKRLITNGIAIAILVGIVLVFYNFLSKEPISKVTLEKTENGYLSDSYEDSETKLQMSIEGKKEFRASTDSIPYSIKNTGTRKVVYGDDYSMEAFSGDDWYEIPFKDGTAFTAIGHVVGSGGTVDGELWLDLLKYKLTKGKYRVIKCFNVDDKEIKLEVEFTVL